MMQRVRLPSPSHCLSVLCTLAVMACGGGTPSKPAVVEDRQTQVPSSAVVQPAAPAVPELGPGEYLVKKGDTLYGIALDNGVTYKELQAWNGLSDPNRIVAGQKLKVVNPAAPSSAAPVVRKPAPNTSAQPVIEERPLAPMKQPANGQQQPGTNPANQAANGTAPAQPMAAQPAAQAGTAPVYAKLLSEPKVNKQPYSAEALSRIDKSAKAEERPVAVSNPTPDTTGLPAWDWPAKGKVIGEFGNGNKGLDIAGQAGDPVKAVGDGKVVYVGSGLRGYGQMVIVKHGNDFLTAYAHNRKLLVQEGQQVSKGQKIAEMGATDSDSVKLHFEVRKQGKPVDPTGYLPTL